MNADYRAALNGVMLFEVLACGNSSSGQKEQSGTETGNKFFHEIGTGPA